MKEEVISLVIKLRKTNEVLTELFVVPSHIIKCFADFLSCRHSHEIVHVKGHKIKFEDCSVRCGDSVKAVESAKCLQLYNIPLRTYRICNDIKASKDATGWKKDKNYLLFMNWIENNNEFTENSI